jgi:hypothetical protein
MVHALVKSQRRAFKPQKLLVFALDIRLDNNPSDDALDSAVLTKKLTRNSFFALSLAHSRSSKVPG